MTDSATPGPCATCVYMGLVPQISEQPRTPRVQDLLRQNGPPLEVELDEFRIVADNHAYIIRGLDEKIAHAQEVLATLVRARSQAEGHLADAKALLHPIRSLPTENLAEIFQLCLPSWDNTQIADALDHKLPPWNLSHVCRRWRDLALSLPSIWTFFYLPSAPVARMTVSQSAYKAGLYLARSGNLPLDVLFLDLSSFESQNDTPHPISTLLELNMHRWGRLSVSGSLSPLCRFPGSAFSALTWLELGDIKDENLTLTTMASPATVPRLQSVEVYSWSDYAQVPLPWAQITCLKSWGDITEGWDRLEQMVNLEVLTLQNYQSQADRPISSLCFPKLVSLDMNCEKSVGQATTILKDFVSALDAPMLSKLTLSLPDLAYPDARSLQNLTDLTIRCWPEVDELEPLLHFLRQTRNVEVFRLHVWAVSQEYDFAGLLAGLTLSGSTGQNRLPRLRVLDVVDGDWGGIDDRKPMWRMLQSRCGSAHTWDTCLETLIVPRRIYVDEDDEWVSIRSSALRVECGTVDDWDLEEGQDKTFL